MLLRTIIDVVINMGSIVRQIGTRVNDRERGWGGKKRGWEKRKVGERGWKKKKERRMGRREVENGESGEGVQKERKGWKLGRWKRLRNRGVKRGIDTETGNGRRMVERGRGEERRKEGDGEK